MLIRIFSSLPIYRDFRKLAVRKPSVIQLWGSAEIHVKTGYRLDFLSIYNPFLLCSRIVFSTINTR